jgi:hypothetical protein
MNMYVVSEHYIVFSPKLSATGLQLWCEERVYYTISPLLSQKNYNHLLLVVTSPKNAHGAFVNAAHN